jgi:hypothetical protein
MLAIPSKALVSSTIVPIASRSLERSLSCLI